MTKATIGKLAPGTRFRVCGKTGTVVDVDSMCARVRWDTRPKRVDFTDPKSGAVRSFVARKGKLDSVALSAEVEVIE